MRVDTSLADSISAATRSAKTASHASTSQSSFKSALTAAAAKDTTATGRGSDAAETTQAVPGHAYAEILTGPRAGMYLNTTHNKRAGEAFVLVERHGVQYHVYGTGKDRTVVEMRRHTPAAPASTPSSTTTPGSITTDPSTL